MKNRIKQGFAYLPSIFIVAVVLFGGYLVLTNINNQEPEQNIPVQTSTPTPGDDTRIYESEVFDFRVVVPTSLEVKVSQSHVSFQSDQGEILFSFNATNYYSLDGFVNDDRASFNQTYSSAEDYNLGLGYESKILTSGNNKLILVYVDHGVYFFSTSSPELYDELEEIVQSFEYTGD